MLIQVEHLSHIYAPGTPLAQTALQDICLQIEPGERIGIMGRSGSGKSTLVQHLAGLLKPSSGRVLLDGVEAHGRSAAARARRQRIGLAFQYPEKQIFEQTVSREVAFGPRNIGLARGEVEERVRWALEMVGLDPSAVGGRVPFALSGGEKRRVGLAGVLALQPEVLILDEPTAGLDPQARRDLLHRLALWHQSARASLVLVSHDPNPLAQLVQRVIVLDGGQIMADRPVRGALSDVALLRAAGLDVPPAVALLHALHDRGWPVQRDRLLAEEATMEIAHVLASRCAPGGGRFQR